MLGKCDEPAMESMRQKEPQMRIAYMLEPLLTPKKALTSCQFELNEPPVSSIPFTISVCPAMQVYIVLR